ncbi:hypothetical protein MMC21_000628 [Puttea exsequens]|nr:hypothetical protein [Puttea exsequens]
MIRQSIVQSIRPTLRSTLPSVRRAISITPARAAEGDTGAPKSGGAAQGDAFSKREQADENYYVRQREMEKLKALKDKIGEHQKHLEELDKHVSEQMAGSAKK